MKKCIPGLALIISTSPAAAAGLAARADALIEPLVATQRFSGAVTIVRNGKIAYSRGFGLADVDAKLPFLPTTPADGGSLAKPVTAAAILLLAHEGRLDLDAPVRLQVPEFPHRKTTVRQLLSHSAGLPDYDAFQHLLDAGPVSTLELIRELARIRPAPAFAPGTRFDYCNLCYDILALIAERLSDRSYEALLRERLFGPARVRSTFLRPAKLAAMEGRRSKGYRRVGDRWQPNEPLDNEAFYGASNLYFNALDLGRWMDLWARRSPAIRGIEPASRTPARIAGVRSGLTLGNWYCAPARRRCYYPGHHQGFHSVGYWDADRRIAVALVSNNTLAPYLQAALPRALADLAEGRRPKPLQPPRTTPAKPAQLAGRYRLPQGEVTIAADARGATLTPSGRLAYRVYPAAGDWFYAPGLDVYVALSGEKLLWQSVFAEAEGERQAPQPRPAM